MTNRPTPETARSLLWRHSLPEDVLDGALARRSHRSRPRRRQTGRRRGQQHRQDQDHQKDQSRTRPRECTLPHAAEPSGHP